MITNVQTVPVNIQNVAVPFDIMKPILIESSDSITSLHTFILVNKNFKEFVENPTFLHSLLIKLKGDNFSDVVFSKDPRKFLVLDRDITQAFKTIISKKSSFINEKIMEKQKMVSSIALKNLELRVFTILLESDNHPRYFRFSETQIEKLKNINFNEDKEWDKCIKNMANPIAEYDFPFQINLRSSKDVSYFKMIESAFLNPNEKMQTLIKDHEITDVFFGEPFHLLINAYKGHKLGPTKLQEAVLEPEEHNRALNFQTINELTNNINYIIQDGNFGFRFDGGIRNRTLERLKKPESGQKDCIDEHYTANHFKFLFGVFFPEIWPNNLNELGKEEYNNSLNYWLMKTFPRSIKITEDQNNNKAGIEFDNSLNKVILNMLKNPYSGLKTFIEEHCEVNILLLCKELLFREIWHDEPLDPAPDLMIEFNNLRL